MEQFELTIKVSPTITNLLKSFLTAKKQFGAVKKTSENPFYKDAKGKNRKYADLSEIIFATEPALTDNGLLLMQFPLNENENRTVGLITVLFHESGEFIEHTIRGCPADQKLKEGFRYEAQTIGIGITYLARYAQQRILNLPAEDDDGNGLVIQKEPPKVLTGFQGSFVSNTTPVPSSTIHIEFEKAKVTEASSLSEPDDGCPKNDEDIEQNDPLPTPLELTEFSKQFKALNQPSQLLKAWVEKHNKKGWKQISKAQFENTLKLLRETKDIGALIIKE